MQLSRTIRDESGFTLPAVIIGMFIAGLISVAMFNGILNDLPSVRRDQDRQRAEENARAGLAWYGFQLTNDQDFWTDCADNASSTVPVNLAGSTTNKRAFGTNSAGTSTDGSYALQLIPADGKPACVSKAAATATSSPGTSMLQNNTLRIASVGTANGRTRKILGVFKRNSFLDFVYYTDYETLDPVAYGALSTLAQGCKKHWNEGRSTLTIAGLGACTEINFTSNDAIKGPFHTQDSIHISGTPTLGRPGDPVEILGTPQTVGSGSLAAGGGTLVAAPASIDAPPDNTSIAKLTAPAWTFTGKTVITISGSTITVNGVAQAGWPPNGVIYVKNSTSGTCPAYYKGIPYANAAVASYCGNAWVSGNYGKSLTIGAANDVIINDDISKTSGTDALLGLIANQFVRVFNATTSNPAPSGIANVHPTVIQAGILAVNHSFIVDNYDNTTGAKGQILNVTGAIAQNFRGPVGTGTFTTVNSGYKKNYVYDDRFQYREPPNFVSPVDSAWKLVRVTEMTSGT